MEFVFSENKNEILYKVRGVSFYQIIEAIAEHGILLNIKHPNEDKYPNQWMMVVKMNNYTYSVPYVLNEEKIYLKTIYPNRKFLHLLSNEEKKNEK